MEARERESDCLPSTWGLAASWGRSSHAIVYLVWGLAHSHRCVANSFDRNMSARFSSTKTAFCLSSMPMKYQRVAASYVC